MTTSATTSITTFDVPIAGSRIAATHYIGTDDLATESGRPVVVLAHGLAGTQDSGLEDFARAFANAGIDAVTFDYRGFGLSESVTGGARQVVSLADQAADLRAVIGAARTRPGVDGQRLALWGISLGGGHVLTAAAESGAGVRAVVAVVPLVDGLAAARHAFAVHSPMSMARASVTGIAGRVRRRAGRDPIMIPVVAGPGQVGALTVEGALQDYLSIAGPSWRNEIAADVTLELGDRTPIRAAAQLRMPTLFQIADFDQSAPPQAAAKAAFAARAHVRHYPGDHFDLFPGKPWHAPALEHGVAFVATALAPDE